MNMQDNNNENQVDDSETDSELESDHNSNEIEPSSKSSKSLSSQLKNKKTASLPKKKKKRKRIAEAWKYFEQEELFAVCQIKKKKEPTQAILEQVMKNIRPHGPNRQNELQAACAEWIAINSISFNTLRRKEFQCDKISNSEDNEDDNESDLLLDSESENEDEFYSQLDSAFATLLDPQTKKMILFTSREREKARIKLKDEFEKLQQLNISGDNQLEQETLLIAPEITQNPFFEGIFWVQNQEDIAPLDEVIRYLDLAPMNYNANPWQW
ncbi:45391_t:CDS:2 [Gigaspora margarita]|uniref:45391_t:CDS:1 n=1 Tax=Gigaspora margarita TaxID=4874 RepID=A0ABM8W5C2_GIGMA|nr:45391_t:CDS:2 [Gigaspora margarita]